MSEGNIPLSPSPNLKSAGAPAGHPPALLVLDDDEAMLRTLTYYFENLGFHVAPAATVGEATSLFQRRKNWTMVISDYDLPDGNGWEFCCWIRRQPGAPPPFLLISGGFAGAPPPEVEFLAKPFALEDLTAIVRAAQRNGDSRLLASSRVAADRPAGTGSSASIDPPTRDGPSAPERGFAEN